MRHCTFKYGNIMMHKYVSSANLLTNRDQVNSDVPIKRGYHHGDALISPSSVSLMPM